MIKRLFFTILWMGIIASVNGQNMQSLAPPIPTSPQAVSIMQHGEFGINYYTGIPNISIPLYTIDHYGYKLPVALSYYPQPVKPGYNYDVYGHGWGLSINSCVSRTIKALPDEQNDFKLESNLLYQSYDTYKDGLLTNYNWEHDAFNVSLPDGSGFDLILDRNQFSGILQYIVSNGRKLKIDANYSSYQIESFVITDENGVKYTFEGGDTPYLGTSAFPQSFISWQLSRIDLPAAPGAPITFEYGTVIESTAANFGEANVIIKRVWIPYTSAGGVNQYEGHKEAIYDNISYKMKLLSSISYGNTIVNLSYENGSPSAKNYVKGIQVMDNGTLSRNISFGVNKRSAYIPGSVTGNTIAQLDRIKTVDLQLNDSTEIYRFNYGGSYYSFSGTDHWGYLNSTGGQYGVGRLNVLIEDRPENNINPIAIEATEVPKNQRDLSPYYNLRLSSNAYVDSRLPSDASSHGILEKIIYPTGGYTEFTFENNRCLTATDYDGSYIYDKNNWREMSAGGFRIKKITNYKAENIVSDVKSFRYGRLHDPSTNSHTGLGEATVDPNILSYSTFSSYQIPTTIQNMLVGLSPAGQHESFVNPFPYILNNIFGWDCSISAANFRRVLDGRVPVVYPEVTVYDGDVENSQWVAPTLTGKTVYEYDAYDYRYNDTSFFEKPQYYGNTLYYDPYKCRYNVLKEKRDFLYTGSDFIIKRKETNDWMASYASVNNHMFVNTYKTEFYPAGTTVSEWFTSRADNIGHSVLQAKSITNYEGNASINSTESYMYNSNNQLNYKRTYDSRNVLTETKMTYPELSTSGTTPTIIEKMVGRNILAPVLKTETFVDDKKVSGVKMDYAEFPYGTSTVLMPSQLSKLETGATGGVYSLEHEVLRYSANGNPVEFVTKSGQHGIYLWGYNDRYMIAEIKNATYAQVLSVLSQSGITDLQNGVFGTVSPNMVVINALRQQLPTAAVSTYTYVPLVGMTSQTDAKGMTTYYEYDNFQRLKTIKDQNGHVIKSYDYHYKTN
ncbi:hypothetical protein [Pedobacter sp. MC2016-24]|uniref:hypothetical protein n=1 Tax=Pedobacter sp. MC2016-24 TaxID=2780090 RepID=UPI00187E4A47|nr:hypothetical protein [Pedobacter sp. MC2016-24]MBE9599468.1 hypothetical protein [Pedobacter sp. MC2016-24]